MIDAVRIMRKIKSMKQWGRISGGTILGMQTVAQHFEWDQYFDLCDDCIGDLKKFLNIKEPDKE